MRLPHDSISFVCRSTPSAIRICSRSRRATPSSESSTTAASTRWRRCSNPTRLVALISSTASAISSHRTSWRDRRTRFLPFLGSLALSLKSRRCVPLEKRKDGCSVLTLLHSPLIPLRGVVAGFTGATSTSRQNARKATIPTRARTSSRAHTPSRARTAAEGLSTLLRSTRTVSAPPPPFEPPASPPHRFRPTPPHPASSDQLTSPLPARRSTPRFPRPLTLPHAFRFLWHVDPEDEQPDTSKLPENTPEEIGCMCTRDTDPKCKFAYRCLAPARLGLR